MSMKLAKDPQINAKHGMPLRKSWNTPTYRRYLRNIYKIENLEIHEEMDSPGEVFSTLKHNWDEHVMEYIKAYKTIVLDERKRALGSIYFEPNAPITMDHIRELFNLILDKIEGARSVMICRNNASNPFMPDEEEKKVASYFKSFGEVVNIPVTDQFVISSMGMYKFQNEDYRDVILENLR